jgi:hypothetical protein
MWKRAHAHPPWAHETRLQHLRPLTITTNVSNKSRNLLFVGTWGIRAKPLSHATLVAPGV